MDQFTVSERLLNAGDMPSVNGADKFRMSIATGRDFEGWPGETSPELIDASPMLAFMPIHSTQKPNQQEQAAVESHI